MVILWGLMMIYGNSMGGFMGIYSWNLVTPLASPANPGNFGVSNTNREKERDIHKYTYLYIYIYIIDIIYYIYTYIYVCVFKICHPHSVP
jgi:hypothetical protein